MQKIPFSTASADFVESLYESYCENPLSVDESWRVYFDEINNNTNENNHSKIKEKFLSLTNNRNFQSNISLSNPTGNDKSINVMELINSYRLLGHLKAKIDPLNLRTEIPVAELNLSYHRLNNIDPNEEFSLEHWNEKKTKFKDILSSVEKIYCNNIASEYMHIPDFTERLWLQQRIEKNFLSYELSADKKIQTLMTLVEAEGLEKYIGSKYPGSKRFSVEGLDSVLVLLEGIINTSCKYKTKDIVIGMPHRGRINVLVNILGKPPKELFETFEGKENIKLQSGDVKYHLGFSSDVVTENGEAHLTLCFNPSHLEIVSPVVCGSVKAREELFKKNHDNGSNVLPIIMHGDAAFAGQGVVMESMNMSHARGFNIGGTIHIILNNQIGFTTSDPQDARSTLYCSDIGKMLQLPIFHVNADDPEAVIAVMELACEYRYKFKKDVIIDLIGYRRHGHNEADEPAATQPLMYKVIRNKPTIKQIYSEKLIKEGVITEQQLTEISDLYRAKLDAREESVARMVQGKTSNKTNMWLKYENNGQSLEYNSKVSIEKLKQISDITTTFPPNFSLHPRVQKIYEERRKMANGEIPIDWGFGEIMAYATLLDKGYFVRMSGQDCNRGTFFHRHAGVYNQQTGERFTPLTQVNTNAKCTIIDSLLSEEAVLAFEYGYASTDPETLVVWEAQFGDFVNGAQVVIDQFISSGEAKWGRLSGITMLLPHGYEGQGPEHSSARLERFLQLCADDNMQVCVPTLPSQIYHLLRRQMLRPLRKPLICITPKSLLRHKLATSSLNDLANGEFKSVIYDEKDLNNQKITRVIFCSGKVYYDLYEEKENLVLNNIALIRIEELYPFPQEEISHILNNTPKSASFVWCQEEPYNQGASDYIERKFSNVLNKELMIISRPESASPAVGYVSLHNIQQKELVSKALGVF